MNKEANKLYQDKGITFSPQINIKSKEMKRSVENLLIWEEVRKIKQSEKKKTLDIYDNIGRKE